MLPLLVGLVVVGLVAGTLWWVLARDRGMIAGIVIMLAAIYVQVMNWVPIAISRSTMLYLTVLSAPAILMGKDFNPVEVSIAIVGGAVFFAGVVKLAFLYAARNAKG